jgi:hypothetical protein
MKLSNLKYIAGMLLIIISAAAKLASAQDSVFLQVTPIIDQVRLVLMQVGPALSAMLFVVAGIIYALGQILPPDKKAQFHTTAVNIIIGAIVVGALSFASSSLASASTHILNNFTVNTTNSTNSI